VIVNDRLDVALAGGASGIHLRGDSMDAFRVREVVPDGFLIGRSVHAADEARTVAGGGGVDYLVFGTVFATSSKRDVAAAGLSELKRTVESVSLPVLAIGGITETSVADVAATGAAGFAAIGFFTPLERPGILTQSELEEKLVRARRAFDRSGTLV
jgi:thiamine-phosphate diphosphorylase